jgi:4,5-dihydroxyphthalate decarboxylase
MSGSKKMPNIQLSFAINPYDHVRDLLDGTVRADGIDFTFLRAPTEEIFYRFVRYREWDVSEMAFGKLITLISHEDKSVVAIPVFPSRVFRHSSIYVRSDAGITRPEQLAGKRIGVPTWSQSASMYSRGMLAHEYGVDLASIHWHQGGVNQPGRLENVTFKLPEWLRLTRVPDRSLSEMLLAGDLDAILSARPPTPFDAGDPRVRRLFQDYRAAELAYFKKTGIFPIMHVIAMRREIYERHPWVAMNLYTALEAAKNGSLDRLKSITESSIPLPWILEQTQQSRSMLGEDFWPYGIEANRKTLEAFTQYAFEHGICPRKVAVEELFPPEVQTFTRV